MYKSKDFIRHIKSSSNEFFSLFSLKYYFKDSVCSKEAKKMGLVISGRLIKQKGYDKIIIGPGEIFGISIIDEVEGIDYIFSENECVVIEVYWSDLLKCLKCPESNMSLSEKIRMIKDTKIFSHLSDWKLFRLAENLNLENYRDKDIVAKEACIIDKFYLIKSGKANLLINNTIIKEMEKGEYFGEISGYRLNSRPATLIANGRVEFYVIEKKIYEEIIEEKHLVVCKKSINLMDMNITLDNLYFVKSLGHGSFGKVFKVHNGKNFFAAKVAEIKTCNKNKLSKYFVNEKDLMASIDHPFIVKIANTLKNKEHIFIMMECIDGITMAQYLSNPNRIKKDVYEVQFYGGILLAIVHYLQRVRVIHRDIKPLNCMIDQSGYLKLIDFGVAKDMIGRDHTTTLVGTSYYMAPEVIHGKGYSFSADYWSIGVLMYEMFYGCLPFGNTSMGVYEVYSEIAEK